MKNNFEIEQKAQVIPILAISLLVIVMMVALVLDGSDIMVNRRSAQNAADAGALAGARELCLKHGEQAAIDAATLYVQENDAVLVQTPNVVGSQITVQANVANDSFFAKVFNQNSLEGGATANAGCFSIAQAKVLPIAWSCRKPVGVPSDSDSCVVHMLDWSTELKPLIDGSPNPVTIHNPLDPGTPISQATPLDFDKDYVSPFLYVVMDSPKINEDVLYTCAVPTIPNVIPPGYIDCDINDDGVNDVLGHGERSWIDLDGIMDDAGADTSNGANALKNWIKGEGVPTLAYHTWLGGQTGVANAIFKTVEDYAEGKVALVPVFDSICDDNPEDKPECVATAHQGLNPEPIDNPVKVSPGADHYFHIMGFSAFYITCVDDGNSKNSCPGASQLIQDNVDAGIWDKNTKIKAIEGYFVSSYPFELGDPGTGGYDVGVYIVSLTP